MDYRGPIEAVLSTDLRGEPYNFSLWDIYTGTQLVVFKGNKGNPIPKCLQLIDNNYFITANDNVLQIWSIFNRKCQDQKLFLPSRPSTLCMSPCGNYLVAGISEMIYIWQLRSGNLLAHTQRHYQAVSVLKMNQDGTFLFSGGEDGIVLVWPFADLISNTHNTGALNLGQSRPDGVNEPRFTWQHHGAQVTDIHVTNGGRCLTASVDMTINIYSYSEGKRLYCVTMPSPIWSVIMNKNETKIFLGAQDGNIYEVAVSSIGLAEANSRSKQDDEESERKPTFVGHKGKIVSLLVSTDGSRLVSASIDSTCKTWDIQLKKLIQDIKHQAPLANLTSLLVPDSLALSSMSQSQVRPPLTLKPLKRNVYKVPRDGPLMVDDLFDEASTTIVNIKNQIDLWDVVTKPEDFGERTPPAPNVINIQSIQANGVVGLTSVAESSSDELLNLKEKIKDLFLLSAEKIFQDSAHDSLKPYKPVVDGILKTNKKKVARDLFSETKPKKVKGVGTVGKKSVTISDRVEVHAIKKRRK